MTSNPFLVLLNKTTSIQTSKHYYSPSLQQATLQLYKMFNTDNHSKRIVGLDEIINHYNNFTQLRIIQLKQPNRIFEKDNILKLMIRKALNEIQGQQQKQQQESDNQISNQCQQLN